MDGMITAALEDVVLILALSAISLISTPLFLARRTPKPLRAIGRNRRAIAERSRSHALLGVSMWFPVVVWSHADDGQKKRGPKAPPTTRISATGTQTATTAHRAATRQPPATHTHAGGDKPARPPTTAPHHAKEPQATPQRPEPPAPTASRHTGDAPHEAREGPRGHRARACERRPKGANPCRRGYAGPNGRSPCKAIYPVAWV